MVFYTKALRSAAYKRLAVVALLAANAFSAWADNRLYIKDFTILSGGEYVVSVQMENDPDIASLQTSLTLPPGMSIVQMLNQDDEASNFVLNPERITQHEIGDRKTGQTYSIMVMADASLSPFKGTSGELFKFKVKAGETLAGESEISLTNQVFSRSNPLEAKVKLADETAKVKKVNPEDLPQEGVLSADAQSFSINPFESRTVTVSLENNFPVKGMTADIRVPEGMSIVAGSEGKTSRTNSFGLSITQDYLDKNLYHVVISTSSLTRVFKDSEGAVFTFGVTATNELPETSQIVFSDVILTSSGARDVDVDGFAVDVTNANKAALPAALAAIAEAEQDSSAAAALVDAALEGNVKVAAAQAELAAAMKALRDKIGSAYEAGKLAVTPYAEEAEEAAGKAAALAKVAAEEKALAAQNALLDSLKAAKQAAEDAVPASVKDNEKVRKAVNDAGDAIQALQSAVDMAYGAGQLADFDNSALRKAAEDAIAEIGKVAAAEKKIADNNRRKTELGQEIDRLAKELQAQEDSIREIDPDVAASYTGEPASAIKDLINQARTNLDEDWRNTALDDDSDLRPKTVAELRDMIAQLRRDADKAQKQFVNDQKQKELLSELQALQDALEAVEVPAAEDLLPGVKEQLDGQKKAIQDKINEMENGINDAAEAVALTAESGLPANTVAADTEALKQAIEDAKAAKEKADRKAANDQRLAELEDQIEALQAALDAVTVPADEVLSYLYSDTRFFQYTYLDIACRDS